VKWYNKTFYLSTAFKVFIAGVVVWGAVGGLIYNIAL